MSNKEFSVIGRAIPRIDAPGKAKGAAQYTNDMILPGMLVGKVLRSPYPHAKIIKIDTRNAEKLSGVKAVVTGKDAPNVQYASMMMMFPETANQYLLAKDKVRFIGDAVAAVAAIDEDIALEALELIEVEYEQLPAYFSLEEALRPDAAPIHDNSPDNISAKVLSDHGDIEKGFQDADYIREDRFTTQLTQHCSLEPHVSLAQFDQSGKLTVWVSTQAAHLHRQLLAKVMEMPERRVRVIKPYVGGAFGGKFELFSHDICCALLAKKSGRPVKICLTREEEFATSVTRHPAELTMKIGVKKDGTITGKQAKVLLDGGAYPSWGEVAAFLIGLHLSLPYKVPNINFEICRVYTNRAPAGAQRGFGSLQAHFAAELQMDLVAEALGIDPMDMRIKNGLKAGDVTVNGLKITSGSVEQCVRLVAEKSEWKQKYKKLPPYRGIGMGCNAFICGARWPLTPSSGLGNMALKADTDGSVTILSGVSDIGQGSDTIFCQIVAEALGLNMEQVRITIPDTDVSPLDTYTASSRVTFMAGNATLKAAVVLKNMLFKVVAEKMETSIEDLLPKDGRIFVKGAPTQGMSFGESVALCEESRQGAPVIAEGSYKPDLGPWDHLKGAGNYSPAYTFGAVVAEVEVDPDTGKVEILKLVRTHDCGTVINLLGVEGQLDGSTSMAIAYALSEVLHYKDGRPMNASFLDYKFPTVMEFPDGVENIHAGSYDPGGPFGAKEAGEGVVSPIAPAIVNAVYDATGIWFKDLPLTPEKVLKELKKKGKELK
ncbi:MAG: molybdopterin cofactor-binding domain-containing protein [Pseudomonadota bacterium]